MLVSRFQFIPILQSRSFEFLFPVFNSCGYISSQAFMRLSPFAALFALCWLLLAGHWVAEPLIDAAAASLGQRLHLCP